HEASETDAQGNVARGDVISEDTEGSYLHSESRLVAAVGLKDHVVIETKDAVLVAPKDRAQDVKKLVARLKELKRPEHSLHREVFRPVLVAPKDRAQDVKKLVARLKELKRPEHSLHREVFRPWGSYDSLENGPRFQVKRLK